MKPSDIPQPEPPLRTRLLGGFQRFARLVVRASGHPMAFSLAIGIILIWAMTGPWFHFGNTWLLVIDTVANIITFLMIFLIRNAQNRESEAVQLKLDELIRATKTAHNSLLDIEELSEADLDRIKDRFEVLARKAREESGDGQAEAAHVKKGIDQAVIAPAVAGAAPAREFVL
jgi:low affinity Fe/Cu permease